MGVIDEDGRPIRGSGALPWGGGSGGVGDMSGVTFSRNIMEKPPSQVTKGNFVADFNKMIEDIKVNGAAPVETTETTAPVTPPKFTPVYPPGTTDESRAIYGGNGETPQQRAERRAQTEIEIKAKRQEQARRMREAKKKKQEERNGGTGLLPKPALPKREGQEAESVEVRGHDEGHGVSPDGMSDVPRDRGPSGAAVPEAGAERQVPAENLQPQLKPIPPAVQQQLREAVIVASQPFHVHPSAFRDMPLDQAEHMLNELRAQVAALSQMVEERRQAQVPDREDTCTWCGNVSQTGRQFGRFPFELEAGSGQWRAVSTCRSSVCLAKQNAFVEKIQAELKAERGG